MGTYLLNYTTLQTLLEAGVSPNTQGLVNGALNQLGTLPGTTPTLPWQVSTDAGSFTAKPASVFLDYGYNVDPTVATVGQTVLATGVNGGTIVDTGPGGDILDGGEGNNVLQVLHGANTLVAGVGPTTLVGGSGNDWMWGGGKTEMWAGTAADTMVGGLSATASDTLVGGPGADVLSVHQGNNVLAAGSGLNTLWAGDGNDIMWGGGHAMLWGENGQTTMVGGVHAGDVDTIAGAAGYTGGFYDLVNLLGNTSMSAGNGNAVFWGGSGNVTMDGGSGSDWLNLQASNASIQGGSGWDTVNTGTGNATVFGGHSTVVEETHATSDIASQTTISGGVTQITFSNGQVLVSKTVTIDFTNGAIHT